MKTWFITGASRGMGRVWAEAALRRGDRVTITARSVESVRSLAEQFGEAAFVLALDVTKPDQVRDAVAQAHEHFGRLDVVLNNVGYPLVGTVEEVSEDDVRAVFDANYLGTLRVIQAALPFLRQQGSGHILGVSSTLGHVAMPVIGMYCATKWAFEALHESLAAEVQSFGIKVSIIEPGAYATEFGKPGTAGMAAPMEAYAGIRNAVFSGMGTMERGDPQATAEAVLKLVDADDPPLRLILGSHGLPQLRATYASRLETWEAWKSVANQAQGVSTTMATR
ncbi:SDR family NAD(P)-dependent oxidoreductase [Terriglobus sp.]|uniref:SDR family NAD(P)-dependent oxidoreductase n=1 Tax=Terriglobus sp. TaxID=1889013 RepID=UPI003AFFA396